MNAGDLRSELAGVNDDVRVYIDDGTTSVYGYSDIWTVSKTTKKCDSEGCDHEHITGIVIHVETRRRS